MKIKGYDVELCTEYAKDLVFDKRANILVDQLYITAKQNRKLERLRDCEWTVTDSPLLLGIMYAQPNYYQNYAAVAFDAWNTYNNINFYLSSDSLPYRPNGRVQASKQEAKLIDDRVHQFLLSHNLPFETITIVPDTVDPFANHIADILRWIDLKS